VDRLVVDASVLTAFFLGEEGSEDIEIILETVSEIHAPLFWKFEVANAIWRRKEISEEKGRRLIERIWKFPISSETFTKEAKEAFHISRKYNLPFYDSSYIAMAKQLNMPLWTLDKLQGNTAMKLGVSLWGN
jgi:predicted nucleic acid-binding protein